MTKYVAVIPSIYQPYTDACVASCRLENILVVDNTETNSGIAPSWNIGVKTMYQTGADWTIIISAGVRFGQPGGLDLVEAMTRNPGALIVEADKPSREIRHVGGFGWHLLAINRRVFDDVGLFDENIWPAYGEDTDYCWRLAQFYKDRDLSQGPAWPRVPVDGFLQRASHGVGLAGVKTDGHGQKEYYIRKWGGSFSGYGDGQLEWEYPFNNPANPLAYWPAPAAGARPGPAAPACVSGGWDWAVGRSRKPCV